MKYLKTYEYNILEYQNYIYKLLKDIVKIVDEKYSVYLTTDNKIEILYNEIEIFTEIISIMYLQLNTIIVDIYNPGDELNKLLITFFSNSMEKIKDENYKYSFKFNYNTKLNIEDFKLLININNYNI